MRHDDGPGSISSTEKTDGLPTRRQFPLLSIVSPPVFLVPPQLRQNVVHERSFFLKRVVPCRAIHLQLRGQIFQKFRGTVVFKNWLSDGRHPAINELNNPTFAREDEFAILVCGVYSVSVDAKESSFFSRASLKKRVLFRGN